MTSDSSLTIAVAALRKRSLRILHIITSVDPQGGGPIEGLKQLARINTDNGHTVHVVSLDRPGDTWVESCPIQCFPLGPRHLKYSYAPHLVAWLKEKRTDYDVVIVNGIWQYHSLAAHRALVGTDTPYFVFTHGMLDPYFKRRYPLKHLKKSLYWWLAEFRVLRDAKAVLFTCDEERRLARESFAPYKVRELVVNYGIAPPPGDVVEQRRQFFEAYPKLLGKRILLSLGRVNPKKGLELAIRAFAERMAIDDPRVANHHLLIAGPEDAEYGIQLREIIKEFGIERSVTFAGMLLGDLKWGAFNASDAFILPSYQENFGIAVAEALACGLPVLISDQVNIWREIVADHAGFVAPATLSGARKLVDEWINLTTTLRTEMSTAALNSYRNRFHAEQAANSLIRAMELPN